MSELKRCLYVVNRPRLATAKLGGGGKSFLTLWKALPDLGWEPHAVCPEEGPMGPATKQAGVPYVSFSYEQPSMSQPLVTWRNYRTWCKIVKGAGPLLIHANAPDAARSLILTATRLRVKVICHIRFPIGPAGIRWVFKGLPKPDAFIFNSNALRDETWPELSSVCPKSRAFVVHNGVDMELFKPAPRPKERSFRIGIIANLLPAKAHDDFLRMAAELVRKGLECEFWIIGEDVHQRGIEEDLKEMARDLGIRDRVQFLGHRHDIPQILAQLHVTVLTSRVEPFGRVLIEAMACGRPVVATAVGGVPEVVKDGVTGYLVPAGDYESLAKRTMDLLTNQTLWKTMSRIAQNDVRQRFSLQQHARAISDAYEKLLKHSSHVD